MGAAILADKWLPQTLVTVSNFPSEKKMLLVSVDLFTRHEIYFFVSYIGLSSFEPSVFFFFF